MGPLQLPKRPQKAQLAATMDEVVLVLVVLVVLVLVVVVMLVLVVDVSVPTRL